MNTNEHEGSRGPDASRARGSRPEPRLSDREVPLGLSRTPAAIHEWLDGAVPESAVRKGEMARHVEFWSRVGVEAEARRAMRTPAHVTDRIMAAIPQAAPIATPWWRTRIELTPTVLGAMAASLLAVGLVIGMQLLK